MLEAQLSGPMTNDEQHTQLCAAPLLGRCHVAPFLVRCHVTPLPGRYHVAPLAGRCRRHWAPRSAMSRCPAGTSGATRGDEGEELSERGETYSDQLPRWPAALVEQVARNGSCPKAGPAYATWTRMSPSLRPSSAEAEQPASAMRRPALRSTHTSPSAAPVARARTPRNLAFKKGIAPPMRADANKAFPKLCNTGCALKRRPEEAPDRGSTRAATEGLLFEATAKEPPPSRCPASPLDQTPPSRRLGPRAAASRASQRSMPGALILVLAGVRRARFGASEWVRYECSESAMHHHRQHGGGLADKTQKTYTRGQLQVATPNCCRG